MNILYYYFLNNSLKDYLIALVAFGLVLIILKIFKTVIIHKLKELSKKTNTELDDILIGAINNIHWPFYVLVSLFAGLKFLNISNLIAGVVFYIFIICVVYYTVKFIEDLVEYGFRKLINKKKEREENVGIIKLLQTIAKIVLWVGAVVLLLSNIGYDVTSLVAGLGIGGIAIALALQNILSDLFASLSIYFDKPFQIGDFVILGDKMGVIKKIGIKTTRLQALQGEEIVISNSELTSTRIQNFGKMEKRRILFRIGVTYDTPKEKLEKISGYLKEIIEREGEIDFDRAHFKEFADSSLVYEIVYYVLSGDYSRYMDIQEKINLDIVEKFKQEEIEMAFPTQTLFVQNKK